jgi:hypothetical protein
MVLEARPAGAATEWKVPDSAAIVAAVFGPQGLDVKRVTSFFGKNRELISQLVDYAEQTEQVGALMETLVAWEQSASGDHNLDAALSGFSSRYGVALPRLDTTAPTNQQAAVLLHALLPSLSSYDPLTSQRSAVMQQSAGLAASVGALFFGSPVGLAAGGVALFQNMRTLIFPDTEFRSAFAQNTASEGLTLCSQIQPLKSRTRTAYLWALRIPGVEPPAISLPESPHLPIGLKSAVRVASDDAGQLKLLHRARDWRLVASTGGSSFPVAVAAGASPDILSLDLTQAKPSAGPYRLTGKWDWDTFEVTGNLYLHPLGDLAAAQIAPSWQDRLLEGGGPVVVQLTGPDFQFVEKVWLVKVGDRNASPAEIPFTLPKGKRMGEQHSLEAELDTTALRRGAYRFRLSQSDGQSHEVPVLIQPPHPRIENLPLRANLGEAQQTVHLKGSGLERIEQITSESAEWELEPVATGSQDLKARQASLKLRPELREGDRQAINVRVQGIHEPLPIPEALKIAGPRPKILSAEKSFPEAAGVALSEGEIPAGSTLSFAMRVENMGSHPSLELTCQNDSQLRQALTLGPGDKRDTAKLDLAGTGVLFLSLDPGAVGQSGCRLTATVAVESTGRSDPFILGNVKLLPRIEQFVLTDEKLGESLYAGILTGEELQTIEKVGWDARSGLPVQSLPTPVAGGTQKQSLKIALPWPSPTPRAPVFIWLRGESEGRATKTRY